MLACAFLTTKDSKKINQRAVREMGMILERGPVFKLASIAANEIIDFPETECVWAVPFVYGIRPYVLFVTRFRYQVVPWNLSEVPTLEEKIHKMFCGIVPTMPLHESDFEAACQVAEGYFESVPERTNLVFFGVRPGGTNIIPVRM